MRYIRIYWTIIKINCSLLFAYRANFYNSLLITVGWGIVSISSIFLLTARVSHIYGWSRDELLLLVGVFSMIVGIFHMLFSSSMERFARTVSLGDLDSYLLMPVDAQVYLSTKMFRPVSILRFLIGFVFTGYIAEHLHLIFPLSTIVLFPILLFLGLILLYSVWFLVVTLLIWNPRLSNLIDFLYIFNNLGRYPPALIIYTKNIFLYVLVPLTLIASVPARFMLGKVTFLEVGSLFFLSIGLLIASRFFWKFALRSYTSASS